METINTAKLLEEVAKEYGKTPEEIRAGIEEAIDAAWNNPDPEVHAIWKEMSPRGERPSVEEALLYLSALVATEELMMAERLNNNSLDYHVKI